MNLVDNPVWVFLSKCVDLCILSLLWLLFSLPVITLGASSAALYYSVHKNILGGESYPVRAFISSFKQNLKQGCLLTLLSLLPAAFCGAAWGFADGLGEGHPLGLVYRAAAVLTVVLAFSTAAYVFPLLSRFFIKTSDLLKAAFSLAITRAGFTLLLDAILAVCLLGMYLIPASAFLLPALGAAAAERLLEPALNRLMKSGEEQPPEEPSDR